MAVHEFTGVTGSIRTSGTSTSALVGYVQGDFTLAAATGKYVELGSSYATANTRGCLLYTSPSPRDQRGSRMPSSA